MGTGGSVNTVKNLRFPWNAEDFLINCGNAGLSGMTPLHGVCCLVSWARYAHIPAGTVRLFIGYAVQLHVARTLILSDIPQNRNFSLT